MMCVRVANAYVCMYVCMFVCIYVCMYVCTNNKKLLDAFVCMYVYLFMCVCMTVYYIYMYVCMYERTISSLTYRSVSVVLPADMARAAGEEDSKNCERREFISKLIFIAVAVVVMVVVMVVVAVVYGGSEHVLPAIQ